MVTLKDHRTVLKALEEFKTTYQGWSTAIHATDAEKQLAKENVERAAEEIEHIKAQL